MAGKKRAERLLHFLIINLGIIFLIYVGALEVDAGPQRICNRRCLGYINYFGEVTLL